MNKAQFLQHWQNIKPNQELSPCPVSYKHEGSTYAEDGIRITGSREWIDSVLSRLQDLLQYESISTRLQVNYQESHDRETGTSLDSWNCYIQVHRRGHEGAMYQAIVGALARS